MNNSIFESIFAVFDDKPPFLSILDTFWPIFGHFSYSTSINHSLTIELNNILNWITRVYFELNNILNWILGKAILNRILNESFFGKIQILNWIRLGIVNHYTITYSSSFALIWLHQLPPTPASNHIEETTSGIIVNLFQQVISKYQSSILVQSLNFKHYTNDLFRTPQPWSKC